MWSEISQWGEGRESKLLIYDVTQTDRRRSWCINPLTPELNPSAQGCLKRFFTRDFASWTVHFFNIGVKN
jgi:hypothetical protein